ncbi:MAG: VOC family protein [Armatimonadetes bacterium]|nr:VOC family protein [Armatimonadota bacterium]
MPDQATPGSGTFFWNQCLSSQPETTRSFYCDLFGWTCQEVDMGFWKYTVFQKDGGNVAGLMAMGGPMFQGVPSQWLPYIAVDNVDAAVSKARELGAEMKCPPVDLRGIGRFSVIMDPTGAMVALVARKP